MKTKQIKEEPEKSIDEETTVEPKTRARKKADEEDKNKASQEDPKTSKEPKKNVPKPKAVVKKKPLGIRKTLRSKKAAITREAVKNVIKGAIKRGRKPAIKTEPVSPQEKEPETLIPASEIKKEPVDDTTPNSRSSSPRTAGRKSRLTSDMAMMKSVLADSPSSLVHVPRTSPYSMRSERSNSPSSFEGKNLRSGKPRKAKANLLNEVVIKEQKKRRRLLSDSKDTEGLEDSKKLKRGRSCSRDGSEISKCSDITESDLSLSESLNDTDSKELNKKIDKAKTDLEIDMENNIQISTIEKVPSINDDSKLAETKPHAQPVCTTKEKNKKSLSLKRSTSLDSDNNSNRLKLENLNSSGLEDKSMMKTENDTLFEARSSILSSMSKTFNSREVSKNIRKARRGRKAAVATRTSSTPGVKNGVTATTTGPPEEKQETLESLSKEIDDLINNLDQNIDRDTEMTNESTVAENIDQLPSKPTKTITKALTESNIIFTPETPIKDKDNSSVSIENTPSKIDDSENIRLHYEEDPIEISGSSPKQTITYKHNVASIDKLMDRLKEFEEFDKRRQRQESESNKSSDGKSVMVTNDVVLIPKSGADINLKDIQTVRSPERPIEKENVLSCFENNSAISIVKRDQVRKSIDLDLPNSITLIKRNSFSSRSRKASTSSNHSKETDAISIFEKSLGKDVTLTEIRKSADKTPPAQVDLHQFATLHPNNPSQSLIALDSNQISILPRVSNDVLLKKRNSRSSRESLSRKSSESGNDDAMATLEKIKSPPHQVKSMDISITPNPVAIKSPEIKQPVEAEALPPPIDAVKTIPDDITLISKVKSDVAETTKIATVESSMVSETAEIPKVDTVLAKPEVSNAKKAKIVEKLEDFEQSKETEQTEKVLEPEKMDVDEKVALEEELKKHVVEEQLPKVAVEEKLKNFAVVENLEKISVEENLEKISVEENLDKAAVEENLEKVAVEENVENVAVKENLQKVAVDENPEKVAVEEKVTVEEKLEKVSLEEIPKTIALEEILEKGAVGEKIKFDKAPEAEKHKEEMKPKEEPKIEKPKSVKGEKGSKSARNSIESQPGPSSALHETPESQKGKENLMRTLGLLTHKAYKEAKIEKLKEKERIYSGMMGNKNKGAKGSGDYTGTLKTVIKLNRGVGERDKKKYRGSLTMTFQRSKHRGKPQPEEGQGTNEEDSYYTIERREGDVAAGTEGGHRKPYSNRLNNHDAEAVLEPTKPEETLNLVIPEKASSFSIHPGRLCQDQCFYCGGKFGLFDTPCHIAQMKSAERQKKVLTNEEKLTIDSCLCDACYRHVDRRANCPSYRKRPVKPLDPPPLPQPATTIDTSQEKPPISPPEEEESEDEQESVPSTASGRPAICHTSGCAKQADHSIRRKWLIKMRASVNKLLKLEGDYPGLHTIPLCAEHHKALAPLMACVLCKRRVTKHHNVHILHSYTELNPLLASEGIPVQFSEKPVVCKLCRYYCSLLQRPNPNVAHAHNYRRKLLQIYNIEVPPEPEQPEATAQDINAFEDLNSSKSKKKQRNKTKQRKSSDHDKPNSEQPTYQPEITENSPEKEKSKVPESEKPEQLEEDIESLISSNKIPVPGAKQNDPLEPETDIYEFDMPIDKQTELQYLLQKQNNPAQFLKVPNLTSKHKNPTKLQNSIQKPGQQQRINDKNAKRIHKLGQIISHKEKPMEDSELYSAEHVLEGHSIFKNLPLNEECTIETIPNKKPADINTLKNKWQMSESFTQVKKNLSELSKKLPVEKEPKKSTPKYLNPVKRLETNPSISVRELFPGEEEMNLQCSIEFSNVKAVTPEGWEKCNSTIQYDVETKKLWHDLQRPYGNQSSFIRHLILLEKYFRNGDLVLSQNATPHAANYSDSVQSRLRAYDNVVNDTPRRAEPAISLIEYRKKPSMNGKSLLKTNQNEGEKEVNKIMPPPGIIPTKPKQKSDKPKKQLPPELIAINTPNAQGRKAIQNVLHNIQQLVKGVSASDPTEVAAAPVPKFENAPPKFDPPPPKFDLHLPKFDPPIAKLDPPTTPKFDAQPPKFDLPPPKEKKDKDSKDTPKKQKPTSKPWRPTLMPITPENMAKIAREPTQVAVDGRHLPSLVQVMSSGKRYHITLQDYNKMCIMRREKLQQLQEDKPKKSEEKETTVVTEVQTSAMLGNGGTVTQNVPQDKEPEKREMPELTQISSNAANILKNVGLKNITIAPIPPKTATITSQTTQAPIVSSPSVLVTSNPLKMPQLGSSVSITSETVLTPNLPIMSTSMLMPKIPKSLTVIPQTVMSNMPQNVVASVGQTMMSPSVMSQVVMSHGIVMPTGMVIPQNVSVPPGVVMPQMVVPATSAAQVVNATENQRP